MIAAHRFLAALSVAVVLTGCGTFSAHEWTTRDTVAEVTFQVANAVDGMQTSKLQYRADLKEGDPITVAFIGENPTTRATAMYFGTRAVSHLLISIMLPKKWRPWFQVPTAGYSTYLAINNCVSYHLQCKGD